MTDKLKTASAHNDQLTGFEINGEARIIYKYNKPYGIRDDNGFLFFFADVFKYENQEDRYRQEVEQQYRLADYLLKALMGE